MLIAFHQLNTAVMIDRIEHAESSWKKDARHLPIDYKKLDTQFKPQNRQQSARDNRTQNRQQLHTGINTGAHMQNINI